MPRPWCALATWLAGAALIVTGCGTQHSPTETVHVAATGARYNDADLRFIRQMMQHNAVGLLLTDIAAKRPLDDEAQGAVEAIRDGEVAEIERCADWLFDWNRSDPPTVRDHAHAHGSMPVDMSGMSGVISENRLRAIRTTAGSGPYRSAWAEAMIEHHEGALRLIATELSKGHNRSVLTFAAELGSPRKAELKQLRAVSGS